MPRVPAALFTERLGRVMAIEELALVRHGVQGNGLAGGSAEHPDGVPWAPPGPKPCRFEHEVHSREFGEDHSCRARRTLKLVRDFCLDTVAEVRSAVIYEKSHSLVKCDYVWRRTDEWINFPWSVLPVARKAGEPITPSKEAL